MNDLAQIDFQGLNEAIPNFNFKNASIGTVVENLIPYIFAIAGFLLIIYLVVGGLEFIFSLGEPKKTASAKGKIVNALLGFLIVFAAYFIVQLIGIIFKVTKIQEIFGG